MSAAPIPTVFQGLGPMGRTIVRAAHADPALHVVAAVDIDPKLTGRPLAGLDLDPAALTIAASLPPAPAGGPTGVLLQATGSYLEHVAPQIEEALALGWHVVSTCEELAYPFVRHPDLSRRLHTAALDAGRTLVGTGVNPGFLMDRLPVLLAAASHDIRSLRLERVQDPTPRRLPFREKVGMNIDRTAFDARAAQGGFGHVGLEESGRLVAAGLGWTIDRWDHDLQPVQPDPDGPVLGLVETLAGATADGRTVQLHFEAQSGATHPYDAVTIEGSPPLHLRFQGGVFGDDATAAAVLRAARIVPSARPGLLTVLDLPLRPSPHAP